MDDQDKLKDCGCGIFPEPTEQEKKETAIFGWTPCDGKDSFKPRLFKPNEFTPDNDRHTIMKACWTRCELKDCVLEHEKHHIEQWKCFCSNVCQGEPAGGAIGFTSEDCKNKAECYGWKTFHDCMKERSEEFAQRDKTCRIPNVGMISCKVLATQLASKKAREDTDKDWGCKGYGIDIIGDNGADDQ